MLADRLPFDQSKVRKINLWDQALKADPGATFVRWSSLDPFYILEAGAPQAVITRFDDAKIALGDHELFGNQKRSWPGMEKYRYWQGLPVVTDTDPPTHTKLRRLLSPAFSPRRLASVEAGVQAYSRHKVDQLAQGVGGGFDIMADFSRDFSMHLLLGLLMDVKPEDRPIFVAISDGLTQFAVLPPGSPPPEEYLSNWAAARAYCNQLIAERLNKPEEDLVSNIIAAQSEGRLSAEELFATFIILFVAGLSSIAHLIGWMIWRLCSNPDQMELLRNAPELMTGAIEETLRIEPIGYTALRWARRDFNLSGLQFRENMPVLVVEGCSNFDPERFADPLSFDITRPSRRDSLSFGYGVHHCIGAPVARMAARQGIAALLNRFPNIRLQDTARPPVVGGPKDRGPAAVLVEV